VENDITAQLDANLFVELLIKSEIMEFYVIIPFCEGILASYKLW